MDINKKRVLIVDDDEQSRKVFDGLLRSLGFETVFASGGEDAICTLTGDPGFALIVTDVIMPRMSGFDFTQKLKEIPRIRKIPVIGTSVYADWHRTVDKSDLPVNGFIVKPVEREAFVKEVDRVLMGALSKNENNAEKQYSGRPSDDQSE
jgi:CheY-like chemotaxis protein